MDKQKQFYYKLGVMCGETLFTTFKYDNFKDLINSMKSILRKYGWDMYLCTFVVQAFKDNSYDFEKSCFMQEVYDCVLNEETLEQDLLQRIDRSYKENNNG